MELCVTTIELASGRTAEKDIKFVELKQVARWHSS